MKSIKEVSYKITYTDGENSFKGGIEVNNLKEFYAWVGEESKRGRTIVIKDIYELTTIRFRKNIFEKGIDLGTGLLRKVRRA